MSAWEVSAQGVCVKGVSVTGLSAKEKGCVLEGVCPVGCTPPLQAGINLPHEQNE